MPTPSVFDFDANELSLYEPEGIDEVLIEQPALYLNHLRIARSLDAWAKRLETGQFSTGPFDEDKYQRGWARALREVAAHLRQAEYVEGGYLLAPDAIPARRES